MSPLTRSQQMARIRGRDTTPERLLRKSLWRIGLRYRLHTLIPEGRPDIVFKAAKVAVFVDGCFFHGCPIHYVRPRTNTAFWAKKLTDNVARDRRQTLALEQQGWRVCRVWEHEVFENIGAVTLTIQIAFRKPSWRPTARYCVVRVIPYKGSSDLERRYLEDLRGVHKSRVVKQRRTTRKWHRGTH